MLLDEVFYEFDLLEDCGALLDAVTGMALVEV